LHLQTLPSRIAKWTFSHRVPYPRMYRPGQLNVEPGIVEATRAEVRALGHAVTETGACGIGAVVTRRDRESGVLGAGADPRRLAYALAY
jgi:gamma-glutamyltranspeptidase